MDMQQKRKVAAFMKQNQMVQEGDIVIAGVSGGADSMTMLAVLKSLQQEMGFELRAVHVHHGIRGKEADRDQEFVEKICAQWEIACQTYKYEVPVLAEKWKLGEEETGRTVRKQAFETERSMYQSQGRTVKIALAHNEEDLAETMIHNLCRGTGLRGLSTMRANTGEIIRPVLCLRRREIREYLEQQGILYIQDSTNFSDAYTRNRIRRHILPLMEQEVNTETVEHLAKTALRIAGAEDYLSAQGEKLAERFFRETDYLFTDEFFSEEKVLQSYAMQHALERLAGKRKDISAVHLEKILELWQMQTSRRIALPYGLEAKREYEGVRLYLREKETAQKKNRESGGEWEICCNGITDSPLGTIEAKIFPYEGQKIEEKKYTKWLDYDKIVGNPCIRVRKTGDCIVINQEGSTKKVSRCMIDSKIPSSMREKIPLITCADEVIWIVGDRISEKYKITTGTKRVLELQYQGGQLNE